MILRKEIDWEALIVLSCEGLAQLIRPDLVLAMTYRSVIYYEVEVWNLV